ncbi:MAG TPA: PilN domain-containing protein [Gammaproteobacteria bacterium]|nr:PilN domain-containing protein [Gammaproteobacteria bacterium]
MKQQINLYQAEFRQPELMLSADQIFLGVAGMLLLIVLCSTGLAVSNMYSGGKVSSLKAELETLKQANAEMTVRVQNRAVDQNLSMRATLASRQLQARQDMLKLVEQTEQRRDTVYFSELLAGLARQHVEGMWLSRIDISTNGRDIYLQGTTVDAKRVPQFVGNLSQENAYAGREFRKVVIRRNEKDESLLDFALTTGDPESESLLAFTKGKEGARE